MKLTDYSKKDIILTALKSELDSKEIYSVLAENTNNIILSDKMLFLANEEEKHKEFVEGLFKKLFPDEEIVIPKDTPVPLPEVKIENKEFPAEEVIRILKKAKEIEEASADFYSSFAEKFDKHTNERNMLEYFAQMEMGHYQLIDIELQNMERFADMETGWSDLMNIGP